MEFVKVTTNNIKTLFEMNRQLAVEENQEALFTANFENYAQGFLSPNPVAFGTLCFQDDNPSGFSVCSYKFATYLGSKVLYIEDIYLKNEFSTEENKKEFLNYLITQAFSEGCQRVEMRVLKNLNWGNNFIKNLGFEEITKWSVYRLSKK